MTSRLSIFMSGFHLTDQKAIDNSAGSFHQKTSETKIHDTHLGSSCQSQSMSLNEWKDSRVTWSWTSLRILMLACTSLLLLYHILCFCYKSYMSMLCGVCQPFYLFELVRSLQSSNMIGFVILGLFFPYGSPSHISQLLCVHLEPWYNLKWCSFQNKDPTTSSYPSFFLAETCSSVWFIKQWIVYSLSIKTILNSFYVLYIWCFGFCDAYFKQSFGNIQLLFPFYSVKATWQKSQARFSQSKYCWLKNN